MFVVKSIDKISVAWCTIKQRINMPNINVLLVLINNKWSSWKVPFILDVVNGEQALFQWLISCHNRFSFIGSCRATRVQSNHVWFHCQINENQREKNWPWIKCGKSHEKKTSSCDHSNWNFSRVERRRKIANIRFDAELNGLQTGMKFILVICFKPDKLMDILVHVYDHKYHLWLVFDFFRFYGQCDSMSLISSFVARLPLYRMVCYSIGKRKKIGEKNSTKTHEWIYVNFDDFFEFLTHELVPFVLALQ